MLSLRVWAWMLLALLLAACGTSPTATLLPTLTLIPPTATLTATPPPPTVTLPSLPAPEDFITPSPTAPMSDLDTYIDRATRDLAAFLGVPATDVQVAEVFEATWTGNDLGCATATRSTPVVEGYRLVLTVDGRTYAYHTNRDGDLRRCATPYRVAGEIQVYVGNDPVAEELVGLARRRVANQENTAVNDVMLVSIRAYEWPDTSLGCPQPGEDYPPTQVEGYQIILTFEDQDVIFHTDFERLVRCAPENVRPPE